MQKPLPRGFTLIELLVVIAIIGLLASIVLASLSSARAKAREVSIKAEAIQMRSLLEQNANDYGSYLNLNPNQNWVASGGSCNVLNMSGTYAAQALSLCASIVTQEGTATGPFGVMYLGTTGSQPQKFSIIVWLPATASYWCVGSSGVSLDPGTWLNPGCYSNP